MALSWLTGEDDPPVVLLGPGDVALSLRVVQASEVAAGHIYWGFGDRKYFVLEFEGKHLLEPPLLRGDGKLMIASCPFDPEDLILIQS